MGSVVTLKNARIVDAVLPELPEDSDPTDKKRRHTERAVLDRYAPSLVKEGRRLANAEVQHVIDAAATVAAGKLEQAHAKELQSLALHMHDTIKHVKGANFWRGVGVMAPIAVALAAFAAWGTDYISTRSQVNAVAITQAATRPDATPMRDAMRAQEGGGFR